MLPYWITVTATLLAAARLTRLITHDSNTAFIRDNTRGGLHKLLTCPWCAGYWINLGAFLALFCLSAFYPEGLQLWTYITLGFAGSLLWGAANTFASWVSATTSTVIAIAEAYAGVERVDSDDQ